MDISTSTGPETTGPATSRPAAFDRQTCTCSAVPDRRPLGRRPSRSRPRRHRSEIAEGVISTAIAVLIVAFLGIGLWKGFDLMMNSATEKTQNQIEQIGG